ncbi:MarR family winged helix-turn-helix transcriptional regulator [Propionibacterium acidifaciens]|uniref:MarR family winged helix-turn-helix transcriptional regulator n=1 Tax=Propionibacterium acidifaciens TaxID=556499 RepID=UPI000F4F8E91|nr:MarR family winged helix-turn-helix transcriptional regulator [Propionibacterium acidifaciens]
MENKITVREVAPLLRLVVLRLARLLRVERGKSALSNNKITILSNLAREKDGSPSRIAFEESQHLQSLTRPLAELEGDALIRRSIDPIDGRRSVLNITPTGREALEADMKLRDELLCNMLAGLDDDKFMTFYYAAQIIDQMKVSY